MVVTCGVIDPPCAGLVKTTLTGSTMVCATCVAGDGGAAGVLAVAGEMAEAAATKVLGGETIGDGAWMSGAEAETGCAGIEAVFEGVGDLVGVSASTKRAGDPPPRVGATETAGVVGIAVPALCGIGRGRAGITGPCAARLSAEGAAWASICGSGEALPFLGSPSTVSPACEAPAAWSAIRDAAGIASGAREAVAKVVFVVADATEELTGSAAEVDAADGAGASNVEGVASAAVVVEAIGPVADEGIGFAIGTGGAAAEMDTADSGSASMVLFGLAFFSAVFKVVPVAAFGGSASSVSSAVAGRNGVAAESGVADGGSDPMGAGCSRRAGAGALVPALSGAVLAVDVGAVWLS